MLGDFLPEGNLPEGNLPLNKSRGSILLVLALHKRIATIIQMIFYFSTLSGSHASRMNFNSLSSMKARCGACLTSELRLSY
jgi:hypothetical protein